MFARDAYGALVGQIQAAVAGITPIPTVAIGWPQERLLMQGIAKSANTIVSLYDAGIARDASRFMPFTANQIVTTAGVTSAVSAAAFAGTATVSLGGVLKPADAVSIVLQRRSIVAAAVAVAEASDTLETIAAALAAAVNADAVLSEWVTASASGAVVTLTSAVGSLRLASNCGNAGTRYVETHRTVRPVRLDVWAGIDAQRVAVARAVSTLVSHLDAHFGVEDTATDGTWIRVRYRGDQMIDDDVYRDIYRWLFSVSLEYGQTDAEALYQVLAFLPAQSLSTQIGWTDTTADSDVPADAGSVLP